ncbi:MAG: SLBB domain-containing protein [Burkholderiaceae bacterium]
MFLMAPVAEQPVFAQSSGGLGGSGGFGGGVPVSGAPSPGSTGSDAVVMGGLPPVDSAANGAARAQRVEIRNNNSAAPKGGERNSNQGLLSDRVDDQAQEAANRPRIAPPPSSDFERFIETTTGRVLRPYGSQLFQNGMFGSDAGTPVPTDYQVSVGDEILVRAWGAIDLDYRAVVDRNGQVNIPRVGTISLAGVKASELETALRAQIGKYFTNFQLSASLAQLRAVQIYVVGQAAAPGMYTLSALSSLVSAIFQVGLPGTNGSYRNIQLKRGNKIISQFDLYEFIASGDSSKDRRLAAGDVIVIPPAGPRVAVLGSVDTPAIYELKPGGTETLVDVLAMAGNGRALSNGTRVQLERIDTSNPKAPRTVDSVDLKIGGTIRLADSDVITVSASSPQFSNAVTLRGNVAAPLRYPFKAGMRIRDLIPEKEALLTPEYFIRRNALVQFFEAPNNRKAGAPAKDRRMREGADVREDRFEADIRQSVDEVNFDYAVVERLDRQTLRTKLIPFNLGNTLADPAAPDNLELQVGDVVTIFGVNDVMVPKNRRAAYVKVAGEVRAPGIYQIESGETLPALIKRIGGLTQEAYEYGMQLTRQSTRKDQEKRYEEALNRLERDLQQSQILQAQGVLSAEDSQAKLVQFNAQRAFLEKLRSIKPTGRIVLDLPVDAGRPEDLPALPLEDGDTITVPPVPETVNVFGAVFGEGAFLFDTKNNVGDYIAQAGGATRGADSGSTFVIRANGSVISNRQSGLRFLVGMEGKKAFPGDTIFVPEDFERTPWMKAVRDVSQIFSQFALGAAAIKVLK